MLYEVITIVTTMMGISVVSSDNPLYFGMLGLHGTKAANTAVKECDLLILVGARVGDRALRTPVSLHEDVKIIHIDIDPAEIGKNIEVNIPVVGDAKIILQQTLEILTKSVHNEWVEYLQSKKKPVDFSQEEDGFVNPKQFISMLSEAVPENTTVVADVGQNQIWTANNFKIKNGRFLTSGGMGTMGYSIPAAIGAKLADESNNVIAICGDGSFQMQMMELATAVQHSANITVVVMKNNRLGMVCELQKNFYCNKQTAVFLDGSPDFIKLAEAYGIEAVRVNSLETAKLAIEKASTVNGVFFIECSVNPDNSTL